MDHAGAEYAVILHDPELRQGLISQAQRSHGSPPTASRKRALRRWLAGALRGVAARVEPASSVLDHRPMPGGVVQ
jgi:hypothetical protein